VDFDLTSEQRAVRDEARAFTAAEIAPHADRWDREEAVPRGLIDKLREHGFLGSLLPPQQGGRGLDMIAYGLLTEEIGRGCSSVRSLLTVHDMAVRAIERFGEPAAKERYLPQLARGEILGAFALSEPNAGSDANSVETTAVQDGDGWVITGRKKWTTFGQIADLYLLFARVPGPERSQPTVFLLPRDTPGLTVTPLRGITGTRASLLAELAIDGCRIPADHRVGRVGSGVSHVASYTLEQGRYSVAWGAVGLGQACLDASLAYANERQQFGVPLIRHQLISAMITDMIVGVRAARLLCLRAGWLRAQRDPGAGAETMAAKYLASVTAAKAADDAVQIHGANGCTEDFPVGRYLRDSKVLEIIEGSTQIQQISIPRFPFTEL
jgi:alkylation response protein AidB-like acyl-CoA dehydrogenase